MSEVVLRSESTDGMFVCCEGRADCKEPCLAHPAFQMPPSPASPPPPKDPPAEVAVAAPEPLPPQRRIMPNRRMSETFPIEADGNRYYATVGYYDRERTAFGEVFINTRSKMGSAVDIAASEAATVASIAIQYGVPPEVIRDAVKRDSEGNPHGPLGAALDALLGPPPAKADPALL